MTDSTLIDRPWLDERPAGDDHVRLAQRAPGRSRTCGETLR